ncbi:glycoside hydrolase family protein [Tichowtungia aerotolerans]|uniref:Sucrase n=1 Tax=Tichowtungia aerotolerans TaxID=2697043 RepID=A0A6P1M8B1_9BACT|nr:glycoside hydrolase family protein [Tichowtungia aerotolerans]QHI68378.1 sucrase [Tichowtungia aerotolerans]
MNITLKFSLADQICPVPPTACLFDPDWFIWGASMVRDLEGLCHLFYSRWPKECGFNAWTTHSEIAHATSDNPLGPYLHRDIALRERSSECWDGACTHNPTVLEHDGRYFLYYMGTTGDKKLEPDQSSFNWIHRNNQRIGVAVADHPNGPWCRSERPLIDADSNSIMVSNPAVTRRPDGGFLMIYKEVGARKPLPFGGPVVHRVATSDAPDGPFTPHPNPVFTCGEVMFPAEDPFIWTQNGQYYAILKDMNGYFTRGNRSLVLFESHDGFDWRLSDPCLISDRTVRFENGSVKKFDYLERPQLYLEDGNPSVLFCAARDSGESCNLHIPLKSME